MKKYFNEENSKLNRNDYLTLLVIIFSYVILSFINLGDFKAPNTFKHFSKGDTLIIKKDQNIDKIKLYSGCNNSNIIIYDVFDSNNYSFVIDSRGKGTFAWTEEDINSKAKTLEIYFKEDTDLGELAFYNKNKLIPVKTYYKNKKIKKLTDEAKTIPKKISFMNSTYFDEIYFARSAYEYSKGLKPHEWVHPPLGKLIQAIPIYLTNNMAPFIYRFMGNISGIIMLIVMYLFGKMLFKKRKYAIFSSLLMYFDTFHFVQTRIGTVDSHLALFIMLSIYFMIKFTIEKNDKYLFLSGLFISLGISVKWLALYSGIALAFIYIRYLITTKNFNKKYILKGFGYFIILPIFIYCSLYLLFPNNRGYYTNSISNIIKQQETIYNYHSKLTEKHDFSSPWYSWPISYRPIWYYDNTINNTKRGSIVAIGNIIIWWMGIISFLYLLIKYIRKKDLNCLYLIVIILSLWLPYIFISRAMFLYHYFSVIPFMMLSIVLMFKDIVEKTKKDYIIGIYLSLVITFFIIYYPVITGIVVNSNYINKLRLLKSWYF